MSDKMYAPQTVEAIDVLSGRALDCAIAEAIFGIHVRFTGPESAVHYFYSNASQNLRNIPIPAYSTEKAAAWTVVEAMMEKDFSFGVWRAFPRTDGFTACFDKENESIGGAPATTAMVATCRAALMARLHSVWDVKLPGTLDEVAALAR